MKKRDLVSLETLTPKEMLKLLELAEKVKSYRNHSSNALTGKTIGLLFQKPSNRTRVSFEVGIHQLGGHCIYLSPDEINLGVREDTADVAKTLSRYLDGIVARTNDHQDMYDLARYSTIPVINGLSDLFHPCQALADIFSIKERFDDLEGLKVAYIGDGNNVCHSLLLACAMVGMNISVASPKGYEPEKEVVELAKTYSGKIKITNDPKEAVKGADVVYSDVWVSMGQETEGKERLKVFKGFQINKTLLKTADPNHIFMHCLPAHRGEEVTADVIDGKNSIIFDQAENRLHVQKAILIFLFEHFK
ncbi:MAG: ornithine carbamoyltransferase [Candidatus Omnitrophica bacterium]|nr:ornithine carbamoyltransferase [Candidatus Omnitrophota bacterium]